MKKERRKNKKFVSLTCFSLHLVLIDVFFNQSLCQREIDVLYHCLIPRFMCLEGRGQGEGGEEKEEKRGREEEGVKMGRRKGGGYPTYTTCCYVGRMDRWTEGRMDRPTEGKTN